MVGAELEKAVSAIVDGHGKVTMLEGLVALAGANGIVDLFKRIDLWDDLNEVQRVEVALLDDAKPWGWWERVKEQAPASLFTGHRLRWNWGEAKVMRHQTTGYDPHGDTGFSVGHDDLGDLIVTTPKLNKETGRLV